LRNFRGGKPKENAVITEIDGTVSFGKDTKGKRKVTVAPDVGDPRDYLIARGNTSAFTKGTMCAPENRSWMALPILMTS